VSRSATASGESTQDLLEAFLSELSALRVLARVVAKIRHEALVRGLARFDSDMGEGLANVLSLMDEIEADFRIIRQKLLS
jgi:hypothetical protein